MIVSSSPKVICRSSRELTKKMLLPVEGRAQLYEGGEEPVDLELSGVAEAQLSGGVRFAASRLLQINMEVEKGAFLKLLSST